MSCQRLRSCQASLSLMVERPVEPHSNKMKFRSIETQRRHESTGDGPLKSLSECFKREVEGDLPVKPEESFLAMIKATKKSFVIHDEAGKGILI
jgi:hypothetical protein